MFPSKVARSAKPKLSLSISSAVTPASHHAPITPGGSFVASPSPLSPTARNTRANQRGMSTYQQATYAYTQNPNTKSILRRESSSSVSSSRTSSMSSSRKVGFREEPVVYCITPVSYEGEGERYVRLTKETRWSRYE
ncbi:MAG: hypothetical protein M1813_001509 [Trichoglossum hirsutum]|nr:MAG: hypothetical protein M1813_001509 [Trichoglossum hirsutum]